MPNPTPQPVIDGEFADHVNREVRAMLDLLEAIRRLSSDALIQRLADQAEVLGLETIDDIADAASREGEPQPEPVAGPGAILH